MMKPNALLVNTSRGPIVHEEDLIRLLKSKEISINLAFDVYDPEPMSEAHLHEFHEIAKARPELRFVFIPHNASADADTRAKMDIMILTDLLKLVTSNGPDDIRDIRVIPSQRALLAANAATDWSKFRIHQIWSK
jgi:lactate dehydrogenase-like 2-hydroxyacid dehydrogenase